MKSVNCLPNVLSKMEAEEKGAFAGIWLHHEGYIAEGPNMNVGFVMPGKLVREGKLSGIKMGNVTVEEGKMAKEMMIIGSGIIVKPVIEWDERVIGDGKEGPVTKAFLDLILQDMASGPPSGWIKPRRGVVTARAASDSSESASTSLSVVKSAKSAWASPEERIGLAGLGIASIIVLWAAINTVTAIDKVPLLPSVFEFVGILFSWWFLYRFLLFKPNRKELVEIIRGSVSVVLGQ